MLVGKISRPDLVIDCGPVRGSIGLRFRHIFREANRLTGNDQRKLSKFLSFENRIRLQSVDRMPISGPRPILPSRRACSLSYPLIFSKAKMQLVIGALPR